MELEVTTVHREADQLGLRRRDPKATSRVLERSTLCDSGHACREHICRW